MICSIDSRMFVSWFGGMVVYFIADRCQKQLLEWCFSLWISDSATLLTVCSWQPWHLHHNATEVSSLLILPVNSAANTFLYNKVVGILYLHVSAVFCLFLYTEPFVIITVFFYLVKVWITCDRYVWRGAERAAETMRSNLGVDGIFVHWFGWGGLRWKNFLPFFYQPPRGRAAPDVLLIHCGGNDLGGPLKRQSSAIRGYGVYLL